LESTLWCNENDTLNPWSKESNLQSHERLLFAAVDYEYTKRAAGARTGTVDCIFNPYLVVGYPMDILDSTPNHPSFHAYCVSITHSFTASSIGTSASFVSAVTYTELANYYMMPVHPWLLDTLGLSETQTLINRQVAIEEGSPETTGANNKAELIADKFYVNVFGVKSVAPSALYDFNTGEVIPQQRLNSGLRPGYKQSISRPSSGAEQNPMLTATGNLSLVYRPIEPKTKIEERWGIKFIDMVSGNYNSYAIRYANGVLIDRDALEPGQSQWLKYS
jgi:hypothetical protein